MQTIRQQEIDVMIEEARQTKICRGYAETAAICETEFSPGKFGLGFRFVDATVGQIINNRDSTTSEVLAIV